MARAGKENLLGALPFRQTPAKVGQKESAPRVSSSLSGSKIPVLSKSRIPPELKQSQQQSPLQQVCPSSPNSKAVKDSKMPPTVSALGAAVLKPAAGLLPKSLSREPLGEVQLSTSGQRNDSNTSVGKEPSAVEFVPDVAALASILSNTGLTHHMLSTTQKPSLARRVPLRGRRLCSASIGTARGAPAANLARMSHIARSTLKDADHPQSYSLTLNTQELKALSTTFKNFDSQHRLEAAKPSQSTENLGVGKCPDSGARPNAECSSSVITTGVPLQSNLTEKKDTAGSSWKEEEFVPDPAAKASIFSNVGLSHFAFGANGKLSLAQRVPMKDVRKNPLTSGGTKRRSPWTYGRVPTSFCPKLRRGAAQHLTETQQVMSEASVAPQITSPGAKEEGTPSSWEKVAVRLFDEEVAASVRRGPAVPVITPEMGKLQRIELLAELLQQEMNSGMGPDVAPSLEKLHKLLSARSSPALEAPQPGLPCTPLQDPRSDACKPTPGSAPTAPPEPGTTLTGQHPVCPNPSVRLVQLPSSNTGNSDQMKHRLSEVLRAPQHFLEACLNDECAFYTARVPSSTQPSIQRCKEPVAKMLDALDTVHFIPISSHQSRLVEEERSLSS
ncbi:tastin isoform X3 [Pogona vitticeps]